MPHAKEIKIPKEQYDKIVSMLRNISGRTLPAAGPHGYAYALGQCNADASIALSHLEIYAKETM